MNYETQAASSYTFAGAAAAMRDLCRAGQQTTPGASAPQLERNAKT